MSLLTEIEPLKQAALTELTAAAQSDPFLVVATGVFALAVLHAFAAPIFARAAHRLESAHAARVAAGVAPVNERGESSDFRAAVLHLLGEVEVVFGLWAFVLFGLMVCWPGKGWAFAARYVETGEYVATAADGLREERNHLLATGELGLRAHRGEREGRLEANAAIRVIKRLHHRRRAVADHRSAARRLAERREALHGAAAQPDAACSSPSARGWRHRFPGTG